MSLSLSVRVELRGVIQSFFVENRLRQMGTVAKIERRDKQRAKRERYEIEVRGRIQCYII